MHSNMLILASQSPRRQSLLTELGFEFTCQPANIDESVLPNERPDAYVERLAREKAQHVANSVSKTSVVLGSDTAVVFGDDILGKPNDFDDFAKMMNMLSGQKHKVLTAISAVCDKRIISDLITTEVSFKQLSSKEIANYWATGEPQDKAGGYGIQGKGGQFVIAIQGSYSAVVGLPLYETVSLLSQFGVNSPMSS